MIALDTNVLVRFLVDDEPGQSRLARRLVQKAVEADEVLLIPDVVLVETVWVLDRSYGLTRDEIAAVLGKLLTARNLAWQQSDRIARALEAFQAGRGGFADYLIAQVARERGCTQVATFDRKLLKESGFTKP